MICGRTPGEAGARHASGGYGGAVRGPPYSSIAAGDGDFGDGAVGGAELQRAFAGLGEDRAAESTDLRGGGLAVFDFDAPVVDAGAGAGELGFLDLLAVVDHQG